MRQLNHSFSLANFFSSSKVYYPALLSPNYDNIDFDPFYVEIFLFGLVSDRSQA
jgi:hypothetical protein